MVHGAGPSVPWLSRRRSFLCVAEDLDATLFGPSAESEAMQAGSKE